MSFLHNWEFDLTSAIITVLVTPLILYLLRIIKKYLEDWGGFLIDGTMYWISRKFKRSLAARLSLKRYCRLILQGPSKYLHVPSSSDITIETDKTYVTLSLDYHGGTKSSYTHVDLMNVGKRIRIIGDPGSGKTSLVKRLERDACHNAIANPARSKLPILYELKNLNIAPDVPEGELGIWLFNELRTFVSSKEIYRMAECFDIYARTSGLLLMLDGLDEVSTTQYPRTRQAIIGLCKKLDQMGENNHLVLTLRTQFHLQVRDEYKDCFPQTMTIQPFSPSDIYEFLTRWPFANSRDKNIARIYDELTDRPSLRELCRNPLILAMYVAEDQASGYTIAPDTRSEFYSKVTEELLVKRRFRQTRPQKSRTKLRELRENILGKLALEHMLDPAQPANTLSWAHAVHLMCEIVSCTDIEAESKLRELAKETGIFSEERIGESIRFIHLTFCEFLAANEAVKGQRDGWSILIERHKDFQNISDSQTNTRLSEVIPFTCGLLPRVDRANALNDLFILGDRLLLARGFLETKLYEHDCWETFLENEREYLLSVNEDNWNEDWLSRLHLFNVVIRDAEDAAMHFSKQQFTVNLEEFFINLMDKQKQSLGALFSAYATHDATVAFRLAEACNLDLVDRFPEIIIKNCDQRPFFAQVCAYAEKENERVRSWCELLCEAALGSKLVSKMIQERNPIELWDEEIKQIPSDKLWYKNGLINRTYFTQCLSIALQSNSLKNDGLPLLNILVKIKSPGSFWVPKVLPDILLMLGLPLMVTMIVLEPNIFANGVNILLGGLSFVFLGIGYYLMIKQSMLSLVYKHILRLRTNIMKASNIFLLYYFLFRIALRKSLRSSLDFSLPQIWVQSAKSVMDSETICQYTELMRARGLDEEVPISRLLRSFYRPKI